MLSKSAMATAREDCMGTSWYPFYTHTRHVAYEGRSTAVDL